MMDGPKTVYAVGIMQEINEKSSLAGGIKKDY